MGMNVIASGSESEPDAAARNNRAAFMEKDHLKIPLVLDVKGNSLDDGPGIRSVVFFKGCPLSCVWCHNPESQKPGHEISFDPVLCVDCGACRKVCPEKALSKENPLYVDRKLCTLCFLCTDVCPSGALEAVGKSMTIEQILSEILPDKPFFDVSGGGVTLSGGEATMFMEFSSILLERLNSLGIHTLIETCGWFDVSKFMDLIFPYVDVIYYDLKIMDSREHKRYCGLPNEKILENFRVLVEKTAGTGKILMPRTPLIPGITDTDENIGAVASFLKELGVKQGALLPYNPLWHEKSHKLGKDDMLKNDMTMSSFSGKTVIDRCHNIFRKEGIAIYGE